VQKGDDEGREKGRKGAGQADRLLSIGVVSFEGLDDVLGLTGCFFFWGELLAYQGHQTCHVT
jgi:hypothetical protein